MTQQRPSLDEELDQVKVDMYELSHCPVGIEIADKLIYVIQKLREQRNKYVLFETDEDEVVKLDQELADILRGEP